MTSLPAARFGFGDRRVLYRPNVVTRLAEPHWSPDGERLVFIEHDAGGGERELGWTEPPLFRRAQPRKLAILTVDRASVPTT